MSSLGLFSLSRCTVGNKNDMRLCLHLYLRTGYRALSSVDESIKESFVDVQVPAFIQKPSPKGKYRLHVIGNKPFRPREYYLLPLNVKLPKGKNPEDVTVAERTIINKYKIASLFSHRTVLLGANCSKEYSLLKTCGPLVDRAIKELEIQGDQVQAWAALDGLCDWVANSLEKNGEGSEVISRLLEQHANGTGDENETDVMEAIRSIATGIPRPGHAVVGEGTFRDGEKAWIELSKEFGETGLAEEVELYRSRGAEIAEVMHLADRSPSYLKRAGGAMLRMFFLT